MNLKVFGFTLAGIVAGFFIGFFVANSLNRGNAAAGETVLQNPSAFNGQVHGADIKEPSQVTGMLPDVQQTIDQAANEPQNFDAQIKAGDMYAKIQQFDKAAKFYEQASNIRPDDFNALAKTGNAYFDAGQFETAEKWYLKALEKKEDLSVRTDLGITFAQRANPDYERAVREFETSLKMNPNHEATLFNLGSAYFKKGDAERARETLAKLEQVNPNGDLTKRLRDTILQN